MDAFHLSAGEGRAGRRFCVLRAPRGVPRGALLHVHALADEMNKSRRMVALAARAAADMGYAVLQIDLFGCGDSSGDFADAAWEDWLADVRTGVRWLDERFGGEIWLWGHRAGALIAAEAASRVDRPLHFLFWQPAAAGKPLLQQFLRLKSAAALMDGGAKGVLAELKAKLAAGEAVEVGGYVMSPALAAGLERAQLVPPSRVGRMIWVELATDGGAPLSPLAQQAIARWRDGGFDVQAQVVAGPAFWQTTEIEVASTLIDASLAALASREAEVA